VRRIKNELLRNVPNTQIADKYGVSERTVRRIKSGESYAHIKTRPPEQFDERVERVKQAIWAMLVQNGIQANDLLLVDMAKQLEESLKVRDIALIQMTPSLKKLFADPEFKEALRVADGTK